MFGNEFVDEIAKERGKVKEGELFSRSSGYSARSREIKEMTRNVENLLMLKL